MKEIQIIYTWDEKNQKTPKYNNKSNTEPEWFAIQGTVVHALRVKC